MKTISYTITNVDLDVGIITLDIELSPGINKIIDVAMKQIVTSNDASVAEILLPLNQIVSSIYSNYFPPEPPRPPAAMELIGRTLTAQV